MVAVKASKMESSSNYQEWKEEELDEVLVKITETMMTSATGAVSTVRGLLTQAGSGASPRVTHQGAAGGAACGAQSP